MRGCSGTSTARTAPRLPPWTGKRVPLASRAPKIVLPRRPNKPCRIACRAPSALRRRTFTGTPTTWTTMGRDKMKSASVHSFHEAHAEPSPASPPAGTGAPFETLVREMLERLGEDPTRQGLRQTPARVESSLKWLLRGYQMSVADVIGDALYSERHENLVCVRDIEIYSLCEHHLLPFFGKAHVAYLPNGRLVGLSKIPRVIEVFARRLQVQERLTDQVADALMEVLDPRGVGVVIEAYHRCMMMRGVEKQNSKTVTSALRGALLQDAKTRDEFLRLVHGGRGLE